MSMARSTKSERTRSRLIQIAAERFAADGYAGTSFASLVEASGQSKGAFYFHFPSKLDLALAAFRAKQSQLIEKALGTGGDGSPLERLLAALEARARAYAADRSLRVLPRLSTEFAQDPELAPVVRELHRNAVSLFSRLVKEAQESGEVRRDLDPDAVARTIFAAIVGMDEISQRETGGADLVERDRDFIRLLRSALEARERPKRSNRNARP
jgi:AcrR family transcriptional regulator